MVPRCLYGQELSEDGNVTVILSVLVVEYAEKALCSNHKVSAPVIRNACYESCSFTVLRDISGLKLSKCILIGQPKFSLFSPT